MLNDTQCRILLACIKYLGEHPCPRCLVRKCDISNLGKRLDTRCREHLACVDSELRQGKINMVRRWIYQGFSFVSNRIKEVLNITSMVPTRVRSYLSTRVISSYILLECILHASLNIWIRLLRNARS